MKDNKVFLKRKKKKVAILLLIMNVTKISQKVKTKAC